MSKEDIFYVGSIIAIIVIGVIVLDLPWWSS
jgi:hypothetical protein